MVWTSRLPTRRRCAAFSGHQHRLVRILADRVVLLLPHPEVGLRRQVEPDHLPDALLIQTRFLECRLRKSKDSATLPAARHRQPIEPSTDRTDPPTAPLAWAQRLKRVFDIDITLCPTPPDLFAER
jgi:hypothetical protein